MKQQGAARISYRSLIRPVRKRTITCAPLMSGDQVAITPTLRRVIAATPFNRLESLAYSSGNVCVGMEHVGGVWILAFIR